MDKYQAIEPTDRGWLWSDLLGLFLGIYQQQLRYFTESGELVPTPQESARQERLAKEQERLAKEQERLAKEREQRRAEKLAQKLRELGINVQVCWEKFCRYWEVEPRFVPMEGNRFHLNATEAIKLIDENTIV